MSPAEGPRGAATGEAGSVRAAEAADIATLAVLEQAVFGPDAWTPAMLTAELDVAAAFPVAATGVERLPLGYAVARVAGDVAELLRVVVGPEHRRRGLGNRLLRAALPLAGPGEAVDRVLLEVSASNHTALRFYSGAGFTEVDRRERYYADGSDAVVMRCPLASGCGWA